MARPPKKRKDFLREKTDKPKHNWSNDCRDRKRMLDMKRVKYFTYELEKVMDGTADQANKNLIGATVANTAAKTGIDEAIEYVDRMVKEGLEPKIGEDVKRLLSRYSKYR